MKRTSLVGVCLLAAWPSRALGLTTESHVGLELHDCQALSEAALREHLELELSTLGLSLADARLVLRCEPSSVAIELVQGSGERYAVAVRVELRDTAKPARERLVALAATELLAQAERAGAAEPTSAARPAPRVAAIPADIWAQRGAERAAAKPRPRIELFVAGHAALEGAPRAALWGGSLGTRWGVSRTWSVLVDTRFERGQESLSLADVRWTLLSGFAGAAAGTQAGPWGLAAGLGVRAGWLALDASARAPNEGLSFTAPWAGVAAPLRIAFEAGGFVLPFIGGEVGYVLAPVRGRVKGAEVLVEQSGLWLSGSVGVAVVL